MKFDYSGENPLFQQVATELENAIFAKIYQAGQQIPSTTEIANSYQINPATILKGINLLFNENIVEKRRGLGVFVTESAYDTIKHKRQHHFTTTQIPQFIATAKSLNLSKDDLITLIEGEYRP